MEESFNKKTIVFGMFLMFIGAGIVPSISGYNNKTSSQSNLVIPIGVPLSDDYVQAYWKFDECSGNILEDSSGNDFDGIIYGATWVSGPTDCALYFDGVNDYVDLDVHSDGLGFNKTDDMIFSFDFESDSSVGGFIFCIAGTQHVPEARFELCPNGSLFVKVWTAVCGMPCYSGEGFNDGLPHQVEVFFNGITANPTIKIYIDGVFEGSITEWLCDIANTDYHYGKIGRRALEDEGYFEGTLDEFKIIKYPGGNKQNPPTIDGPTEGEPLVEYEFTFITEDPEGDDIWLHIDWDDGTEILWDGPYKSGEVVKYKHAWDVDDKYEVKAESKDIWSDSVWSDHYIVRIGNQPPEPPEITGQRYGDPYQELTYTFVAYDYENQNVKYKIDWNDGTTTETDYYPSNTSIQISHSWEIKGDYNIIARAIDTKNKEGDPSVYYIRIGDQPPSKPNIYGAVAGIPGIEYEYGFISFDPENDNITYEIDWGDGNIETDIGPFLSGEIFPRSHSWNEIGTYSITARAKDNFDYYSIWSEHNIIVPRNKAFNFNILELLFERFPYTISILKCLFKLVN